jgi:LysM repeat protein
MKTASGLKSLIILIILFVLADSAWSQVVVERSKDKVIISGVPYYIHQVKKGETAYSISRAYGIGVDELTKENPPAIYGVNEGQSLRIPVKSVDAAKPTEPVSAKVQQRDETKFIYHSLKPGETIYSLSKYYGVSENDIIQSNPGIDITKLSVGVEIAVPKRVFMSNRQKFDDQEKKFIYHKVLKGESLSSIAQQYGLTVRVLRRENRDLRFPQVGDFVRVPATNIAAAPPLEQVTDTQAVVVDQPAVKIERPAGFTPVKNLRGSLNVAVLLPFYLKENAIREEIDSSEYVKGRKQYKVTRRPDEWIFPVSLDFLEMYEGILLAADTLRSLGLDINIIVYDIGDDTVEMTRLINSGGLSRMDLIIGPVYSDPLSILAGYAKKLGVPVVSPVALKNNTLLINNPTLFMTNSSLEVAQKALSRRISEYYDNNIVFIHTDSTGTDPDVKRFKNMIFSELSYKLPYEDIKYKEFLSGSIFDNDSINRLSHALSDRSKNLVIIASEDFPVISDILRNVHGLSKKYDVKVFGYPVMRDVDNLEQKVLFDLDLIMYSSWWIDYNKKNIERFNTCFRQKFLTEPMERSYAWLGYDIGYYFISGLAMNGKNFIANPEMHYPELLQTEFDFERKDPASGFENQKLFLIRYNKDYEVKLLEDDNLTK